MQYGEFELDPGFVKRVVITTVVVGVFGALVALVYLGADVSGGVLAGAVLGAANLWFLWKLIRLVIAPVRGSGGAIVGFALAKIVGVYGLGAVLLIWVKLPPVWVLAGFSLVLLVVVLKVGGLLLSGGGPRGRDGSTRGSKPPASDARGAVE